MPDLAFWAQRGRALTAELVGGHQERLSGGECAKLASRATSLLPIGTGGSRTGRLRVLRDHTVPVTDDPFTGSATISVPSE